MNKIILSAVLLLSLFSSTLNAGFFSSDLDDGIELSMSYFDRIDKETLPKKVNLDDENSLITFASQKLDLDKSELKLIRHEHYIIIHYENAEYIKNHPKWELYKYGEAMVIDSKKKLYNFFRLSRT